MMGANRWPCMFGAARMLDLTDAQLAGLESGEITVDAVVAVWRPPQMISTAFIRWTDAPRAAFTKAPTRICKPTCPLRLRLSLIHI